ncbi:MAG: right-handed parallel beta-helix repeat-containing protein [Deltaproteobacteria bacterium]|nr:right-handed parallel beta-helix repeat-containing protein [Deltaproteobacteria bacterium]
MAFICMPGILLSGCVDDDIISVDPDYNGATENLSCDPVPVCPTECRYYVSINGDDSADGQSWKTALRQIQPAINKASCAVTACKQITQCDVWVAGQKRQKILSSTKTDYSMKPDGSGKNDTIRLRDRVNLYGGFEGTETTPDDRWFVQKPDVANWSLMYTMDLIPRLGAVGRIMEVDGRSRVDGFEFLGGLTDIVAEEWQGGGAIWAHGQNVTIANCMFEVNGGKDVSAGGAIFVDGGDAQISYSVFTGNSADTGGAIALLGSGAVTIDRCAFNDNKARVSGGAIHKTNAEALKVSNSIFYHNSSSQYGGAIGVDHLTSYANTEYNTEEVLFKISNAFFVANESRSGGSAISVVGPAPDDREPIVQSCTFFNNTDLYAGVTVGLGKRGIDRGFGTVTNSIIWSETMPDAKSVIARKISNSVVKNWRLMEGEMIGEGIIDSDPMITLVRFSDYWPWWSYTLAPNSPCIDSGLADTSPATDLSGNPRVDISSVENTGAGAINYSDIGAIEFVEAQ